MSDFWLKLILCVSVSGCLGAVSALCDIGLHSFFEKKKKNKEVKKDEV